MQPPAPPQPCNTTLYRPSRIRPLHSATHRRLRLLLHLVLILLTHGVTAAQSSPGRPNVLMIAIDDQNDWIGCLHGHPQARTPAIDALAASGTLFANAHCQSPLCNPSRCSLLTGRRPSSSGVYGLSPALRDADTLKNSVTLPRFLRQHGYSTRMAGKIFHGAYGRSPADDEFSVVGPASSIGPRPKAALVQTPSRHPLVDWGTFPHRDEDKGDYQLATWTIEQLQQQHTQPFFIATGFFLPHVPCYVTQQWFDLFPEDSLLLPPVQPDDRKDTPRFSWYLHWKLPEPRLKFLQEQQQWKNLVRSYLASTAFVDAQIGRILEALRNSPHADNTVVVLWSDHGWHLGKKLITGKNSLWDRSTRVPLIFAGPGVRREAVCQEPAELLDIYPTLVELCSLPTPADQEGHSLMPQLQNPDTPRPWPAITTHNHDNHGIRTRNWRYIRYADGSEELYDMQQDPHEWTNLAQHPAYAAVLAEHRQLTPATSRQPVEGSRDRILLFDSATGRLNWEGADIPPGAPIPELED